MKDALSISLRAVAYLLSAPFSAIGWACLWVAWWICVDRHEFPTCNRWMLFVLHSMEDEE
jgi:hypothetical protein